MAKSRRRNSASLSLSLSLYKSGCRSFERQAADDKVSSGYQVMNGTWSRGCSSILLEGTGKEKWYSPLRNVSWKSWLEKDRVNDSRPAHSNTSQHSLPHHIFIIKCGGHRRTTSYWYTKDWVGYSPILYQRLSDVLLSYG